MSQASSVLGLGAVIFVAIHAVQFVVAVIISMLMWAVPMALLTVVAIKGLNMLASAACDRRNASYYGKPTPSWSQALREAWGRKAFS